MAFEELTADLSLDASGYESGVDSAAESTDMLADSTAGAEQQLFALDSAGVAAGTALAGLGAAITAATEDTKEWRETLGRTSTTMGMTRSETQQLATEISNATFPMDEATATMDALAQQGVETEQGMRDVAGAADSIADATGATAQEVAENAGPALAAMGEDVEDLSEHMDTFTYVARNTTMDVSDFSRMVRKTGPELREMGMSVDETASVMAALEERGMDSRTAMREFRQAARAADGDQEALKEELGLTNEELAAQQEALDNATGITEEHAEAANESVTTMDRMSQALDEAKLRMGGLLEPVEAAGPALMGLGGAMSFVSAVNWAAVIPSLSATMAVLSPLLPVILGLAAGAAALYAAWDSNFLGIQNVTQDVLDALGAGFDWLKDVIDDAVTFSIEMIMTLPEALGEAIDAIPGVDSEDVLGEIDTDSITDTLFPPEPEEEGEDVGESMGEGASEGVEAEAPEAEDVVPEQDAVADAGEQHGESYASSFDGAAASAVSGAAAGGVEQEPIRSDGLTDAMRETLQSGVEGYQSENLEDADTEIDQNLWDAMIEETGGVSPERLGVSNEEFRMLQQRFGDGGAPPAPGRSSGGGSSNANSRTQGSSSTSRVVDAIDELRAMLASLSIEGELDVDDDEWDALVDPRVRAVLGGEIDRQQRGVE
jgi:ABC-type transporter Mla subunit MlaD